MTDETALSAKVVLPEAFKIDGIDELRRIVGKVTPPPPLGVLENFTGDFSGFGLNTIFRPNNGVAGKNTTFAVPVTPPVPQPPSENVLEINLTQETLSFSSSLGAVPNRGLTNQEDISFNGVPYVQAISDITNFKTGKADPSVAQGIHFEPGMWLNVPATTNTPVLDRSLVRMASIPHGATINAQGPAEKLINGAPNILPVSITPFVINAPANLITFASQTLTNKNTPRIPQDLTLFNAEGTITQAILSDPNTVLRNANKGLNIVKTLEIKVSTLPPSPEFGGGTTNIAFLEGNAAATTPNARSVSVSATFWIETVEHKIVIPVFKPGQPPLKLSPTVESGQVAPIFHVEPPHEIKVPITITVHTTQIQYSQVVNLNFAGLTWPHVSVATLKPKAEQTVPPTAWPAS